MKASPEDHARVGRTALLVGFTMATLASCAEAHHGSPADADLLIEACTFMPVIPVGASCSFEGRCAVLFTSWVDGMCGDEGYECQDGRVVEYENLRQCGPMDPGPDPNSPCSDTSARAEAFSLSASSAEGAVLGVTQACTSANGWGDCDGGTVTVELLDVDGNPLGWLALTFEDTGQTSLPRTCRLTLAADPMNPLPCTYEGQFGEACGGTSPYPRLCGELAVEIEGETHQTSVGLDAWSLWVCF
ncbi:MAG: hypothetical protein IPL19_25035 [Sandaracinaceae bacterium]|nr:hypothetical protein [Sandaracinaceae bacterium]MBP7682875.1 hypothetical protein [Deltaproteobacteria bacterium]